MSVTVIDLKNNTEVVTDLITFITVDKNGNEGLLAILKDGAMSPILFGEKKDRDAKIKYTEEKLKEVLHKVSGYKVKLVRFSNKEVLKEY